ncbi:thioesterase family protein [Pelistega suis]|uniref:thioesterase family protein n=1 Tax=Pelistega suis TaxID=1631957 RepID=UPI00211B8AFA|nr:thioesterase family protein [Pelistega suis]MCQ9327938.1 thioesterase family protein [Pelistega suis]
MTEAYYQLISREMTPEGICMATYAPTQHAQGAWNPHEQHMAPASGVMARELENFNPRDDVRIGRVSYDIFGLISLDRFTVETKVIRPGKTIELLEATMKSQGKTCIVARAWRMMMSDTSSVSGLEDQVIAQPMDFPEWGGMSRWAGGYIRSVTVRASPDKRPGKGIVWISTSKEMVEGETTSSFTRLLGLIDTANGIVPRQEGEFAWAFPNLDLQVHMHRLPQGDWLGLETVQQYGGDGIGLTSSILHDVYGPFGRSEQILTIRPMPK